MIPLSRPIKVGFVPVLRRKGPSYFLSSLSPIFLTCFTILAFLCVSYSSYGKVLQDETFSFLSYYELWSLSISEYPVVTLFPDSPTKMREDPGAH